MKLLGVLFWVGLMMFPNLVIHLRLCELWLINFVVPIFPVADDIDENIFFEVRVVINCQTNRSVYVFDVLAVYMDDWDVVSLKKISSVFRWAGIDRFSCIANLIICDYMY